MARLVTRDAAGGLVSETDYGSLYRGVALAGPARDETSASPPHEAPARTAGPPPPATPRWAEGQEVPYHLAHVYTECARIWNPIHTDLAVARAAGCPAPSCTAPPPWLSPSRASWRETSTATARAVTRDRRPLHRHGAPALDVHRARRGPRPPRHRLRGGRRPGRARARRRSAPPMKQMSRRDRILAALRREPVDRVPYAVWRHFPAVDRSPAGLAQATLRFHERYGSDFLKLTPGGGYAVEAWGCVEGQEVRPDGHRAVRLVRRARRRATGRRSANSIRRRPRATSSRSRPSCAWASTAASATPRWCRRSSPRSRWRGSCPGAGSTPTCTSSPAR